MRRDGRFRGGELLLAEAGLDLARQRTSDLIVISWGMLVPKPLSPGVLVQEIERLARAEPEITRPEG